MTILQIPRARRRSALQTNSTVSDHSQTQPTRTDSPDVQCQAIIDKRDDQPDICTLYSTAHGESVTTTWLSAEDDSYVLLEDHR